jgi:hypothetical protein
MLLNSTLSINLDGTITFRPALVVVCSLNNDSGPILNYSGNTCKLGCVRPSEGISHSSPTHALKREHTTTRAGIAYKPFHYFISLVLLQNITMYGDWWGIFGPFYLKRYIT